MKWKNKKVLITGAGGFIGSHLTEELVKLGADVRTFVRYNSRNDWGMIEFIPREMKGKIEIFAGDVRDSFQVREAVKNVNVVFHLAALIGVPYSYYTPESYVKTNVDGTLNVMQACLEENVEKVVHTSTSEVYGSAQYIPVDEKHPLVGQSPYSASKIAADKIAESFYFSFDLPIATIRPFNTYGPMQSARAIVPTIIIQALVRDEVRLGSLTPIRDLTYVKDIVNGFVMTAESKHSVGEVINVGYGSGITIGELAEKIIQNIGKNTKVVCDKERIRPDKSEVTELICDNSKARRLIGWKPKYSLDEKLDETTEWYKNHLILFKDYLYNI